MNVSKTFLSALAACFGLALFVASCATPSTTGTTCPTGQMSCGGVCTDVTTTQNCGACGNVCGTGRSCQAGACKCGAGLLDCNNMCLPSSSSNCGACGVTCSGTMVCNNNACATGCGALMQCPGGTCANLVSDNANCGSCGVTCSGGTTCQNSACACPTAGQILCGGVCCASGQTCTNNTCTTPTGTGGTGGTTGAGGRGGTTGAGGTGGSTAGTGGSTAGTGGSTAGTGGSTGGRGGTGGGTAGTTGVGGAGTCAIVPPPGAIAADVISDFEEGFGVLKKQGGRTGYWTTYNNDADPQNQTPTEPAIAMADKIAVTPGGVCANNAFQSSATGQDNYVGFGAPFKPNMPLVSEVADAYDVSAWDGITFRARTGGGPSTQPVFVEVLTKDTQPATSGGTVPNTAERQRTDLYNNRGFMATITSTNQQFFVPFGALIPRSLPAQSTAGCAPNTTLLCQAPKFVPANALGIQFSWYGPMDTPGFLTPSPVGSYNVVIDDVAFYKRSALPANMSDLPALPNSGGMHPLQENPSINSRCTKPMGANGRLLALAYDNWKKRFVRAGNPGQKVIRPENGDDTVSEGIAYGMLIAVYFDDKPLFDGLFQYWNSKIATNGLMTWCIPANTANNCNPQGGGTATDADEDAAFAMLMASKQWPTGGYGGMATTLINAVMSTDMSGNYIKAGSNYSATGITNPSYFAPAFYRAFAANGGGAAWTGLADNSYTLLNASLMGRTNGLVPAWCTGGTCAGPASNGGADDMRYQYDSHRTPWRIGLDYCWYGTAAGKTYADKTSGFFSGKATNGVGRVFDIFELSGTETGTAAVNSGSAIGTAAAGAMTNTQYSTFMNNGYQLVLDLLNRGEIGDRLAASSNPVTKSGYSYFNATVGLLMLLTMTGNFVAW